MRLRTPAVCLLLLAAPFMSQWGEAAGNTAALREAAGYYRLGWTSKAIETCLAALYQDPYDEDVYDYALEILPDSPSKHTASLRRITAKASANRPDCHIYYLGFCKLFRGAGQKREALLNCKKARALEPASWPVYRELGLTYSANGDGVRAAETLALGVELSSDNYKAYYYLAAEYERLKDDAAAGLNYRKALELAGTAKDPDAASYSGLIRGKVKKLTARLAALKTAKPAANPAPVKTAPPSPAKQPAGKAAPDAPEKLFETCAKEAEALKKSGDAAGIEKKLAECSALAPREPQTMLEHAGYLTRLGKYEAAAGEYQKAAVLFGGNDPMAAFCQLKTAQAYARLHDTAKAIRYYSKALELNKNDLNALLGLAEAREAAADFKTAGALYAQVLKAEPANAKARERLDEINFNFLSDSQMLDELKSRGAVEFDKSAASQEDIKLLKTLRLAERSGAVDYLRSRTAYTSAFIVEKQEPDHIRLVLTPAGYKSYVGYQTRDAIGFFERKGIRLRDVFTLRDLKGRPIFEPGGRLTEEGLQAYRQAKTGEKTWLMHYEAVSTPEEEKLTAEAEKLMKSGFREISEPEYLWLMRATDCPDDVLRSEPCGIKLLKMQRTVKYFLCWFPPPFCSGAAAKLVLYIDRYRAGDTDVSGLTRSTAFFGTGAIAKKRFCHQGKIWNGE